MSKIVIIGAGAMGSAFALPCLDNNHDINIVGTHLENDFIDNLIKNDNLHPGLKTKIPKEINIEAFKLFFSDKKYANMRDEIGKEFRNNEFPNLLLHPEIIFQYMEHREINVVTWMQFFEIVSDLLKTYRNRIILHEIYSNIKEKANQTLFPQLLFELYLSKTVTL